MQLVNLSLVRSPWNWVTVGLMALFGLMLLAFIAPEPSQETN